MNQLSYSEEGQCECWGRGGARGLDLEPDKFENYLGELKENIRKGVSESGNPSTVGSE